MIASAIVPEPWRLVLWAAGLVTDVLPGRPRDGSERDEHLPVGVPRLSERYGQLTLIVGEAFTLNWRCRRAIS